MPLFLFLLFTGKVHVPPSTSSSHYHPYPVAEFHQHQLKSSGAAPPPPPPPPPESPSPREPQERTLEHRSNHDTKPTEVVKEETEERIPPPVIKEAVFEMQRALVLAYQELNVVKKRVSSEPASQRFPAKSSAKLFCDRD